MPLLSDAKTCLVGQTQIKQIYAGTQLVWPKNVLAQNLRVYKWAAQSLCMYVWESYPVGTCCGFPSYVTAYGSVGIAKLSEVKSFGCRSAGGFQAHSYLPPVAPGLIQPNTMVCSGPAWNGAAGKFDAGIIYYATAGIPPNSGNEVVRLRNIESSTLEEIPTQFLQNRCP